MAESATPQPATARTVATEIVRALRDAGYIAYFAGGCVRDKLLGLEPKDYDVATDARPDQVRQLFRSARFVGEAFGVSLVRKQGVTIEVATFRTDGVYADGRRPGEVTFTDAEHDAQRRDFTINGLFEDPLATTEAAHIIDYVKGKQDIRDRRLRAIGNPADRFAEDYLRMLRAVRFAARFDLSWDEATRLAITQLADRLGEISRERIGMELRAMVSRGGKVAANSIELLAELGLADVVLNAKVASHELSTVRELKEKEASKKGISTFKEEKGSDPFIVVTLPEDERALPIALACWLLDRAGVGGLGCDSGAQKESEAVSAQILMKDWLRKQPWRRMVAATRRALALNNEESQLLNAIFDLLQRAIDWPSLNHARQCRLLGHPAWPACRVVLHALLLGRGLAEHWQQLDRAEVELHKKGELLPAAWITGDDLIAAGLTPGPKFKRLLDEVYDAQLEGRVRDKQAALDWVVGREG